MISFEEAQAIVEELERSPYQLTRSVTMKAWEYDDWWYFPSGIEVIGSCGTIIDKADGHFNILGSAFPLEVWLWGHERGFKHDTYDLVITSINDYAATEDFLCGPNLRYPTVNAKSVKWYRKEQVRSELNRSRPIFHDQRLALGIPTLQRDRNRWFF